MMVMVTQQCEYTLYHWTVHLKMVKSKFHIYFTIFKFLIMKNLLIWLWNYKLHSMILFYDSLQLSPMQ